MPDEGVVDLAETPGMLRNRAEVHSGECDVTWSILRDTRPSTMSSGRGLGGSYSRECLAVDVSRHLTSEEVMWRLTQLVVERGTPAYLRSDNGPEFVAKAVREWLGKLGVGTLYIESGSPWENGYLESLNGKLRDEVLAREVFDTLLEPKVLVARWRRRGLQLARSELVPLAA